MNSTGHRCTQAHYRSGKPTAKLTLTLTLSFSVLLTVMLLAWPAHARLSLDAGMSSEARVVVSDSDSYSQVLTVSPTTRLQWQQSRSSLSGFYRLQASHSQRHRRGSNPITGLVGNQSAQHSLNLQAGSQWLNRRLQASSRYTISQQLQDPVLGLSLDPTRSANQTTVKSLQGRVSLAQRLSPRANLSLSLQASRLSLESRQPVGLDLNNQLHVSSRSGRHWWQLSNSYSWQGDNQLSQASISLGSYLSPSLQSFYRLQSQQASHKATFWHYDTWYRELGLILEPGFRSRLSLSYYPDNDQVPLGMTASWQPTRRTSASLSYQYRLFGNAWQADVSHATRLLRNHLSYSDSLTSYERQLMTPTLTSTLLCPADSDDISQCDLVPVTPENQPVTPATDQIALPIYALLPTDISGLYRLQALSLSSSWQRSKTTLSFNTGITRRSDYETDTDNGQGSSADTDADTVQQSRSAGIALAVRVNAALNTNLRLDWINSDDSDSQSSERTLWQISSTVSMARSQRLAVSLNLTGQQSSQGSTAENDNDADRQASASIRVTQSF